MQGKICFAVPQNMLMSLVPLLFQASGTETHSYRNVCSALTDYEPVAGLNVYSLCNGVQPLSKINAQDKGGETYK